MGELKVVWDKRGLSPRVRGNLHYDKQGTSRSRSIPACAGEPALSPHWLTHGAVYPRVCGGTINFERPDGSFYGLSPRVRGNPRYRHTG